MQVRLVEGGVTTEHASVTYRSSESDEDWIFRYDYERQQAEAGGYAYPVAHLHVNAEPRAYRGPKPFPDLHLPTRRLPLEGIIRHLIVEHEVPTVSPREEALEVLVNQEAEFKRKRSDRP